MKNSNTIKKLEKLAKDYNFPDKWILLLAEKVAKEYPKPTEDLPDYHEFEEDKGTDKFTPYENFVVGCMIEEYALGVLQLEHNIYSHDAHDNFIDILYDHYRDGEGICIYELNDTIDEFVRYLDPEKQ